MNCPVSPVLFYEVYYDALCLSLVYIADLLVKIKPLIEIIGSNRCHFTKS